MEAKESKFNIVETLKAVKKAREELKAAVKMEANVTRPILTDYSLLAEIFGVFCGVIGKTDSFSVEERQVFIFVVQYLYYPRNFFGGKMPKGLRREIAKMTGTKAMSVVSREAAKTAYHYRAYTKFRESVNSALGAVMDVLREKGHIK